MKDIQSIVPGFDAALDRASWTRTTHDNLARGLARSVLPLRCRAQIALLVSQQIRCDYSLWVHGCIAQSVGMTAEDILLAQVGSARDKHEAAVLRIAYRMMSGGELRAAIERHPEALAGAGETVLTEIAAHVAYSVLACYVLQSIAPRAGASTPAAGRHA
jgi:AhpD family alkylhydroperoxidase